jgi:putative membrane protein
MRTISTFGALLVVPLLSALAFADNPPPAHDQVRSGTALDTPNTMPVAPTTQRGASAALDPSDRKFMDAAAMGGLAEVKMGQLAAERGTTPEIKEFGRKMVEDHSNVNNELKALAERRGVQLPTELSPEMQRTYDRLAKLSGTEFDRAYLDAMVHDHNQDLAAFRHQAESAKDPELRAWAAKTLPVIRMHDSLAHQDEKKLP